MSRSNFTQTKRHIKLNIMKQTFGIIGSGNIGKAVAGHLLKAGYQVTLSNHTGAESLSATIAELGAGAKAGTTAEAAQADIVVLALPWSEVPSLTTLRDWTNRIVIDATNHFITYYPDFEVADLDGKASSEIVAQWLPAARIVKAFNTLFFKILAADPKVANGNRVLFVSGDEPMAKKEVAEVIKDLGFAVIDLGSLAYGSKLQQAKGAVATLNLIQIS
ncbi:NADP oxidoreductase [Pedobacter hiemivivus]|uniref:NADP oxidoreductase n=1 Tax=Pedobacter hiemivivus TaxID=2530454 RepID=A0A4U1GFS3_9SPHI|nr:NADP oxidoreductase [Pedobacter hiemivivus]TKC62604.1 NADP oxidoreductase [Pedobacter hiemivivus]